MLLVLHKKSILKSPQYNTLELGYLLKIIFADSSNFDKKMLVSDLLRFGILYKHIIQYLILFKVSEIAEHSKMLSMLKRVRSSISVTFNVFFVKIRVPPCICDFLQ